MANDGSVPVQSKFLQPHGVFVRAPQLGERRPMLTIPANVLPFILADCALGRWIVTFSVLGTAVFADVVRHSLTSFVEHRYSIGASSMSVESEKTTTAMTDK